MPWEPWGASKRTRVRKWRVAMTSDEEPPQWHQDQGCQSPVENRSIQKGICREEDLNKGFLSWDTEQMRFNEVGSSPRSCKAEGKSMRNVMKGCKNTSWTLLYFQKGVLGLQVSEKLPIAHPGWCWQSSGQVCANKSHLHVPQLVATEERARLQQKAGQDV